MLHVIYSSNSERSYLSFNMKLVSTMNILKKENFINWALFLFYCLLTFSVFIGKGGIIRILSAINVVIVFSLVFQCCALRQFSLPKILLATSTFILVNMIATKSIWPDNEYLKIFFSMFFGVGLYVYALTNKIEKKWILNAIVILLISYVIFQLAGILLLANRNGTFKNPHYIALFSAYASIITVYYFFAEQTIKKLLAIPIIFVLLGIILLSSSRPTWISLFLATFLVMLFLNSRLRWISLGLLVAVPSVLYLTNLGNFGKRMADLIINITQEERVAIWSDTWTMQTSSSFYEWLFGHGMNSFEGSFKEFSRYHLVGNDFTMPHNSILEVLYATGIVGLAVFVSIYGYIFHWLFKNLPCQTDKKLGLVLLAFITVNLIMSLITIKWFTHLNSYPLAFVIGMISYMEIKRQRNV